DLFASCAGILDKTLPDTMAEDSVSILPALEGKATEPIHEAVVHHSINGSFAIRQGNWKLELCPGSGGWSAPSQARPRPRNFLRSSSTTFPPTSEKPATSRPSTPRSWRR
ncbi:MAG: hypothetical protein CFE26_14385, partial [Verrucomicrobiales bacterium VVV1]